MKREHPISFTGETQLQAPSILPVRNLASSFSSVNAQSYNLTIEVSDTSCKSPAPSPSRDNASSTVAGTSDGGCFEGMTLRMSTLEANDLKHIEVNAARRKHVSPNKYFPDSKAEEFSLPDIELSLVLERLTSLEDLASAACVCRSWRAAASESCQLRAWTYDEDLMPTSSGPARFRSTTAVVLPKTPQPRNWVDPQAHSPLAHFSTPKSLLHRTSLLTESKEVLQEANHIFFGSPNPAQKSAKKPQNRVTLQDIPLNQQESSERGYRESRIAGRGRDVENVDQLARVASLSDSFESFGVGNSDRSVSTLPVIGKSQTSPRTPSPARSSSNSPSVILGDALTDMAYGRYIKEIDIRSSKLDDPTVQCILRSCPRLQTLRLQHSCAGRQSLGAAKQPSTSHGLSPALQARLASGKRNGGRVDDFGRQAAASPRCLRGCSTVTDKGFQGIATHSRSLTSVTLLFQHVMPGHELQHIMSAVGAMPRLHMLALEFRMPSFPQSLKAQMKWQEHVRFTDHDLEALLAAGPPPLHALALNQCRISPRTAALLAAACPDLEALDLSCDVEQFLNEEEDRGLHPSLPEPLAGHAKLTALGLGIFTRVDRCSFAKWQFPVLRRLRLESKLLPSLVEMLAIQQGCPLLESLHLLWDHHNTKEAHVCPVTDATIRDVHEECRTRLV